MTITNYIQTIIGAKHAKMNSLHTCRNMIKYAGASMFVLILNPLCYHYKLQRIIGAKHVKINSLHAEK